MEVGATKLVVFRDVLIALYFPSRMVENEILNILRQRFEDCVLYEAPDHAVKCKDILANYENAAENWFVKCKSSQKIRKIDKQ